MGARGHGRYARGDNAVAICERCGVKTLRRYLVYDGQYPDLLVCSECWDPKHPQEYLPDVSDPVTLYDPTGDPDKQQANILTVPFNPAGNTVSYDPESSIPPYAASPFSPQFENITTNPLEVQLTVGASQYSLVVGQDPAVDGFPGGGGAIPPPAGNVLAISDQTSLEKPIMLFSENDIETWLDTDYDIVGGGTQVGDVRGLCWAPAPYNRWISVNTNLGGGGNNDNYTCDDATITALSVWTQRNTPFNPTQGPGNAEFANGVCIAVHRSGQISPTRLGIIRSTDGGASWSDVSPNASTGNALYSIRYRKGNEWWAGGGNGQMARSLDNGLTWTTSGFALPASGGNVRAIEYTDLTVAGDRQRIHANVVTASATEGIYYSDDNCLSWTKATGDVPDWATGVQSGLRVNPNTGTIISVGHNGGVYRSTDNGASYTQIVGQINAAHDLQGLIYQDNSEAPYGFVVFGRSGSNGEGVIWTSIDDGVTWQERVNDTSFDVGTDAYALASPDEYIHDQGKNFGAP